VDAGLEHEGREHHRRTGPTVAGIAAVNQERDREGDAADGGRQDTSGLIRHPEAVDRLVRREAAARQVRGQT